MIDHASPRSRRLKSSSRIRAPKRTGELLFENLETRCMLSVSPLEVHVAESSDQTTNPHQATAVRTYLAANPETAHLQQGVSNLRLIEVEADLESTTTRFQQTQLGLPIHDAVISVVQGQNGDVEHVYNHGHQHLRQSDEMGPAIVRSVAERIAVNELEIAERQITSEPVWFYTGDQARLAWQVTTTVVAGTSEGNYVTLVGAYDGAILSHDKPDTDYYAQFDSDTGVYPRIVINDTIGASGSRTYAAPFDDVVALTLGCTGTLIAPDVVLTARHCGGGPGSQIRFGDNSNAPTYTAVVSSRILPAGGGSLLDGGDVAIMRLTQNVPTNVATPRRLIEEGSGLVGEVAATLGYGYNGVGSQGHQFNGDDRRWGGENIIDRYGAPAGSFGSNIFSTDFDNGTTGANTIGGSDPNPLQFEATTAPGDSGGPLLAQRDGEWLIAGVLSGGTTSNSVYGDISWWTGVAPYRAQIEAEGGIFLGGGLGTVDLDKGTYLVNDTITVTVRDPNAIEPIAVTLTSDSGDSETLALTSSGGISYTGTIMTSSGTVSTEDGTLQVALQDDIQVTYDDPDDGTGAANTANATATIGNIVEFPSSDVPVSILDNQTVFSDIVITDSGTLADVDVQVNITHTYDADLDVFLNGPDGTRVELFTDVGGSGNNFSDTILDDEANTPITSGSAPFIGRYSPEGSLSAFDGDPIAGTWTLEIRDDAGFDQGTLNDWALFLDVVPDAVGGDFNGDGNYDCADIDALVAAIVAGTNDGSFDLTGDGLVNLADRNAWLSEAGEANLGPNKSYLVGDINLDGDVDGQDFLVWNGNKFTAAAGWCAGDLNADGTVDGSDFLDWNANKFQSSDREVIVAPLAETTWVSIRPSAANVDTSVAATETTDVQAEVSVIRAASWNARAQDVDAAFATHGTAEQNPESVDNEIFDKIVDPLA